VLVLCRAIEEAEALHRDLLFFARALGCARRCWFPRASASARAPARGASAIGGGMPRSSSPTLTAARSAAFDAPALIAGAVDLRTGGRSSRSSLTELLAAMGYRRVQVVAAAGEFAPRQGRIDVFPAAGSTPCASNTQRAA
jgi:hypothetical protein